MSEGDDREGARLRHGFKAGFDHLNERLSDEAVGGHLRFLNFGFRPVGDEVRHGPELPRSVPNRDSAQLLLEVVHGLDLRDATVLEVGCGRAGNLWLARTLLGARRLVGVDLSAPALQAAARGPAGHDALLAQGDAEAVPVRTGSIDVVVNVESSCCYPDVQRFYAEVARCLRPGGAFAYADLLPVAALDDCRHVLGSLGLVVTRQRDITPNVTASRQARAARQARLLARAGAAPTPDEWVGEAGSALHDHLTGGDARYVAWQLERDHGPPRAGDPMPEDTRALLHANARFTLSVMDPDAGALAAPAPPS